jgi:hypothetical protein
MGFVVQLACGVREIEASPHEGSERPRPSVMNERAKIFIAFLILIGLIVAMVAVGSSRVPSCDEGDVIVGIGDFDKGRWSRYICVPLDTLKGSGVPSVP